MDFFSTQKTETILVFARKKGTRRALGFTPGAILASKPQSNKNHAIPIKITPYSLQPRQYKSPHTAPPSWGPWGAQGAHGGPWGPFPGPPGIARWPRVMPTALLRCGVALQCTFLFCTLVVSMTLGSWAVRRHPDVCGYLLARFQFI